MPAARISRTCAVSKFVPPMRPHLARAPELVEPAHRLEPARLVVIPPVKLDEIETLDAQARERAIDDRFDVGAADRRQYREIRHQLGVDAQSPRSVFAARLAQPRAKRSIELFDAGIDVGAIKRRHARVEGGEQILERAVGFDSPVSAGELPSAADDAGDHVVRRDFADVHAHALLRGGRGIAVVSPWRNLRRPVRTMRRRLWQCGSGQAISASVVIQSFGCVGRCLAARRGRTDASE